MFAPDNADYIIYIHVRWPETWSRPRLRATSESSQRENIQYYRNTISPYFSWKQMNFVMNSQINVQCQHGLFHWSIYFSDTYFVSAFSLKMGFGPSERVLFLGEGNFSYSASLLKELITKGAIQDGRNVTVTCYEARYPQCCGAVPIWPGSSQSRWRLQLWPRSPQFVAEKKVFYKFSLYRLILFYIIVKFFVYLFL